MVLYVMDLGTWRLPGKQARKLFSYSSSFSLVPDAVQNVAEIVPIRERVRNLAPQIRARVLVYCDVIYILQPDSRFLKTATDCFRRKTSPVLEASEAFFLSSGNYCALFKKAR